MVDAIIDHTPPGERVVVTDDDLNRTSRQQIRTVFDDALLITPMPSPGLSDQHLDRIHAYVTAGRTGRLPQAANHGTAGPPDNVNLAERD